MKYVYAICMNHKNTLTRLGIQFAFNINNESFGYERSLIGCLFYYIIFMMRKDKEKASNFMMLQTVTCGLSYNDHNGEPTLSTKCLHFYVRYMIYISVSDQTWAIHYNNDQFTILLPIFSKYCIVLY